MKLVRWNRPIVRERRMLFEQLEERIVLDASVDSGLSGADSLVNSQQACSSCMPQSSVSPAIEASMLSQQVVTDFGGNAFYGRFQAEPGDSNGILHATGPDDARVVKIVSNLPESHTVYLKFYDWTHECHKWGKGGQYTPADFPGWTQTADCNLLSHELKSNDPLVLNFDKPDGGDTTITLSLDTTTGCNVTQAEITVHNEFSGQWHDGYDISLVNGFNYPVKIDAPYTATTDPYTPGNPIRCLPTIEAKTQLGNSQNPGVFGLGNDQCCASCRPPSECCSEWGDKIAGEAHPTYNNVTPNCPGQDPWAPCDNANPKPVHSGDARCDARPRCQMDGWHSQATGKTFTVTFGS